MNNTQPPKPAKEITLNKKEFEDIINHGNSFLFDKGFTHEQLEIIKTEMLYTFHLRKDLL